MRSYFNDKDRVNKEYDFENELVDIVKEIRDMPDNPDRYAAEMILLSRQSQKIRHEICEAALDGKFSEDKMEEICKYFEEELVKIKEFSEKI